MNKILIPIALVLYVVGAILYTYPGFNLLWERSTTLVMSDGTDPASYPQAIAFLTRLFKNSPLEFLYGAIHMPVVNAPEGSAVWMPLNERLLVTLLSAIMPLEQVSTGLVLTCMVLDGMIMFLLARALAIPGPVSWGMGAAWAFSAYTRARAKVHFGLVGIHHLPLLFLALLWALKPDRKRRWVTMVMLLVVAGSPHYYLVMLLPFVPVTLLFLQWMKPPELTFWRAVGRTALLATPAFLWVAWSLLMPLPLHTRTGADPFPTTGKTIDGSAHPFLYSYAARPLDYFTGDVGIGIRDPNPLKQSMNTYLASERFFGSNPHERAQGVRWLLWGLGFAALVFLLPSQKAFWQAADRRLVGFFAILGIGSMWLSFSPDWGASLWLHRLVSQFRVPNRAGIGVAFSLIMMSGLWLKAVMTKRQSWAPYLGWVFVLGVLLEYPPGLQPMPVARVLPVYAALQGEDSCGLGMHYPYISANLGVFVYYYYLQRLRGSRCASVNGHAPGPFDTKAMLQLAPDNVISEGAAAHARLKRFVDCVPLTWVVFGYPLPLQQGREICQSWGWKWGADGVCVAGDLKMAAQKTPLQCIGEVAR
jgi:hypothetical protein